LIVTKQRMDEVVIDGDCKSLNRFKPDLDWSERVEVDILNNLYKTILSHAVRINLALGLERLKASS